MAREPVSTVCPGKKNKVAGFCICKIYLPFNIAVINGGTGNCNMKMVKYICKKT